jgi:MFS family permease
MVATFPGRTHGLGLITESILQDLALDRTIYGYYNLWATLIGALFCIPIGSMLDRSGCRKVLSTVLLGLGISVICMSMVQSKLLFFICLVLTRGFGQSALSVASITLISKYFPKSKLGYSMGIYSVLTSVFFMLAFWAMGAALENISPWTIGFTGNDIVLPAWRIAWCGLGLILLFVCVPTVLFCVRSRHTIQGEEKESGQENSVEPDGIPFARAIRTPSFWIFGLSISFFGLVSSGIGLNNEDILSERGFDVKMYHFLMILPLPFGLLSNLAIGYLARYVRITYLLIFSLFFTGLAKFLFPFIQTPAQVYAYTIVLAVAGGGLSVLFFIAWAHIFGQRDVGKIQGVAQMMSVFASALGPIFFAYSKEWTNSYTLAFYISGVLTILFAVSACFIKTEKTMNDER